MEQEEAASSPKNGPLPVLQAMLICDQVIVDARTQKKSIIGLYDEIQSLGFPFAQDISIFARITDAQGEYDIKVELARLEDDKVIGVGGGKVKIEDRLSVNELIFDFPPTFPNEGVYEFRLFANDAFLGRVPLKISRGKKG